MAIIVSGCAYIPLIAIRAYYGKAKSDSLQANGYSIFVNTTTIVLDILLITIPIRSLVELHLSFQKRISMVAIFAA